MRYSLTVLCYNMRRASIPVALVALMLLIAVPVGGAPSLQVGSSATYNIAVTISFSPPFCETSTSSGPRTDVIYCPSTDTNLASVEINGTLGWTATGLNSTTAVLNVTRDLSRFLTGSLTMPVLKNTGSFNEPINLSNRTISIMSFITPLLKRDLQGLPGTSNSASTMSNVSPVLWIRHPIYSIWWVNGPLRLNETVPVLTFPTNVTSSTSLNIPNIGTRTAWTLTYNLTLPSPEQETPDAFPIPVGDSLLASFSFNYDQQSDLLLSAGANIHLGLLEPVVYQPTPCVSSRTTYCPATSSSLSTILSGVNIQATITLSKTNLNLDQRLDLTHGNGSGSAGGSGEGSGTGGTSSGSGSTGNNGGTGPGNGGSPPASTPQLTASKPGSAIPWTYWIVGIIALVIIVTGIFFARRRARKNQARITTPQQP